MYYSNGLSARKENGGSPYELFREATGRRAAPAAPMTEPQARQTVRKLYLEVLHREPDYPGALGYLNGLVEGRFGPDYIRGELTRSAEYSVKFPGAPVPTVGGGEVPGPFEGGLPTWLTENWLIVAAVGAGLFLMLFAGGGGRR